MTKLSNSNDVIDSRDVIARIEELEEMDEYNDKEKTELAVLKSLAEKAEVYSPDWQYGSTLIRDSYFTDYCEELCKDIGDLPKEIPHYIEIDWEKTADNMRLDYTSVEFDGVTYFIR